MAKRYQRGNLNRRTDNTMAKRYQRGNQNRRTDNTPTTQWPKDTKELIRMEGQHNGQKIPKR